GKAGKQKISEPCRICFTKSARMHSILKAEEKDAQLLSEIGRLTFLESHGNSAKTEDINSYVAKTYSGNIFKEELSDTKNIYYIIYHNKAPAGYSKIIFNAPYTGSPEKNISKMERLYLL